MTAQNYLLHFGNTTPRVKRTEKHSACLRALGGGGRPRPNPRGRPPASWRPASEDTYAHGHVQ